MWEPVIYVVTSRAFSGEAPFRLNCDRCPKTEDPGGTWVAQSVGRLTSAQVMMSRFVGSGPPSGSVLTAPSLEPASDSVSLSLCPCLTHTVSLSLKISKH